jgi:hypothetical protein
VLHDELGRGGKLSFRLIDFGGTSEGDGAVATTAGERKHIDKMFGLGMGRFT